MIDYSFYEEINALANEIVPVGPGSDLLSLPRGFQKWRMAPDGIRNTNVTPASAVVLSGVQLVIRWARINSVRPGDLGGWVEVDDARHFGYLHFVAPINGTYHSWPIEKLRGGVENSGTSSVEVGTGPGRWVYPDGSTYADVIDVIYTGKVDSPVQNRDQRNDNYRPRPNDKCGFWVGGWQGGTDRRTDILPWRWGDLAAGGSQPPPDVPDPPVEPPTPNPEGSAFTGTITGTIFRDP